MLNRSKMLATSLLAAGGRTVDRVAFARRLYGTLEDALDAHARGGFDAVAPRFEARFRMAGRRVQVRDLDGVETSGVVQGIDADGALLIEGSGTTTRVVAGDVTLTGEGPP